LASLSLSPDGKEGLFLDYGVGDPTPRSSQTGSPPDRNPAEKAGRIDEDGADINRARFAAFLPLPLGRRNVFYGATHIGDPT
jgi:hypothetical protein